LLFVSILLAYLSPGTGFESSIYAATPTLFWITLALSMFFGLVTISLYIVDKGLKSRLILYSSVFLIFLSYATGISLFLIRGYFLWSIDGDVASHIYYMKNIIGTGHFSYMLIYPASHIIGSSIHYFAGIGVYDVSNIMPVIFYLLYLLFLYLLARSVISDRLQAMLVVFTGSVFLYGVYLGFMANVLANFFLPLAIYVFFKYISNPVNKWLILSTIMVLLIPIFHVITAIALVLLLATSFVFHLACDKHKKERSTRPRAHLYLLTLLVIALVIWISSFEIFNWEVGRIFNFVVIGWGSSDLSRLTTSINTAQNYGYDISDFFIKTYGTTLLYILLPLAFTFVLYLYRKSEFKLYLSFISIVVAFSVFIVLLYQINVGLSPLRFLVYVIMISTILVSYVIFHTLTCVKNIKSDITRHAIYAALSICALAVIANSLLTIYPSPYVYSYNFQTPKAEVYSMDWLLHEKTLNTNIYTITISPFRSSLLLLTQKEQDQINVKPYVIPRERIIPYHFNYSNNGSLGSYFKNPAYLAITERDRIMYSDIFPDMARYRFLPEDFDRLQYDSCVNKIYSSSQMELMYVPGSDWTFSRS
jgi:hypothetical protein